MERKKYASRQQNEQAHTSTKHRPTAPRITDIQALALHTVHRKCGCAVRVELVPADVCTGHGWKEVKETPTF